MNKTKRILPPYCQIEWEKFRCRPQGITANAHDVMVPLQNLLDHTVTRILDDEDIQLQIDQLVEKNDGESILIEFIYKYGFDGTGGMMKVKQVTDEVHKPGALFASNMVSLQLISFVKGKIYILFFNACCNSAASCRPIRHQYISESREVIANEDNRLNSEIQSLKKLEWTDKVTVGYFGIESMNDGKVQNVVNENPSSQRCPICLCGPRDFNDLERFFRANVDLLAKLCIGVLHVGLRGFEHICKVDKS